MIPAGATAVADASGPGPRAAGRPFGRLVVVSHRLPVSIAMEAGGARVQRTVGGLSSGIEAFLRTGAAGSAPPAPALWLGWPGDAPTPADRDAIRSALKEHPGLAPVFIDAAVHSPWYDGFSNGVLWPLCHTVPSRVRLDDGEWSAYAAANASVCDALLPLLRPGDAVWIHDYHLMLLPALLRARSPHVPIAYFHHIPFPALDVLRVLPDPWARALLDGLLGADVVGLQTYDDVRKLVRAAEHLLGVEAQGGAVTRGGRLTLVDAFPIGVDFPRWDAAVEDPVVVAGREAIAGQLKGRRLLLSIDRLDYTKGLLHRLLAFERLLEQHPGWRDRVVLVAVVVPSREGVEAYQVQRTQIEEAVGRVNGRYGSLSWTPILYRYRALDASELAALYLEADVALVTPLRDGMNLVAKEFLATRRDGGGVLVLSDMAGAARELGEAVLVNPFHVEGMVEALQEALEMPPAERRRRAHHMRTRLRRYDVVRWGGEQLSRLAEACSRSLALGQRHLPADVARRLVESWRQASSRLLLLDYDGTLVPFSRDPVAAAPDAPLLALLRRLGGASGTRVVVVSGRAAGTLEEWLGGLPVALVAEHGARRREPDGSWTSTPGLRTEVLARVLEVMEVFADRLPGAFVERKERSLGWHWRAADPDIGALRARELTEALAALGLGPESQVVSGNKVLEVREATAHKGTVARRWASGAAWGVILAAGDDTTDEDMFGALPPEAWSLRVGPGESRAHYNVADPAELRALLAELARASEAG